MSEPVSNETSNDESDAVHCVPAAGHQSLLATAPPHGCDSDTRRGNHGLERPEAKSEAKERGKVGTCRHDRLRSAPEEDSPGDYLAIGELHENVGGEGLEDKLGEVQDGAEPGILQVLQLGIFDYSEDGDVAGGFCD